MAGRFLQSVGSFLRTPIDTTESRRRILARLGDREASFLALMRDSVYGLPGSPYLGLLRHAGVTYPDVEQLVREHGIEGALARLYDAGVHVTLDEFKARRPIRRGPLEIRTTASSFDASLPSAHFVARTGGSRGEGRRLLVDLELLSHEACYEAQTAAQFDVKTRPKALWRPVPPGTAGLKTMLRFAKIGAPVTRWFSQSPVWSRRDWRHSLFTSAVVMAGRAAGQPFASPEHVPITRADRVARWLADCRVQGTPGLVDTNAAAAVRVCRAAGDIGLNIAGSLFRVGGEPLSPGKVAVIDRAGCRVFSHYSMSEVGRIANACAKPRAADDSHVAIDKVALLQRDRRIGQELTVPALLLTTLIRSTPKVMINVELGDHATLTSRRCGCVWDGLGFTQHLEDIRSYEKLTAEGMHFVGADLEAVLDQVLPERFGGGATDFQLVEEEHDGTVTITLNVSPRLGAIDDTAVRNTLLAALAEAGPAQRMMADRWHEAGLVRVVRAEPESTRAGKILSLHQRPKEETQ